MRADILSIGDELISGKTVNTNASWIGQQLLLIGIPVRRVITVGDDSDMIQQALRQAEAEAEIVLLSGGLGPTHDDITRSVICSYFSCELVYNEQVMERIRTMFRHRGIPLARSNESQAMVPAAAEVVTNERGTAPGYRLRRKRTVFYVMPGVPHEMKDMMTRTILPELQAMNTGLAIASRVFCTTGIAESLLFEKIGDVQAIEQLAKMAFLPSPAGTQIRLIARGANADEAAERLQRASELVQERTKSYIYADRDIPLEEAVGQMLRQRSKTVAVAESCTGGLIAHKLTGVAGSSDYFERGVVCYSNRSKTELLSVPAAVIEQQGAVSEEVAAALAQGVRRLAGTDFGLSTTGIAGPGGGTADKPVGLVYIGLADAHGVQVERHVFSGERWLNKERFATAALNLLRKKMAG